MKYKFDDMMKNVFCRVPADDVNEELIRKLKENENAGEKVVMFRRCHMMKKAAAAAAIALVLCGGVTAVDAATGGNIRETIYGFFASESYSDGKKVDVKKYVDKKGRYTLAQGDTKLIDKTEKDWDTGRPGGTKEKETGEDVHSDGFSQTIDGEKEALVLKSTDDSEKLTFGYTVKKGKKTLRSHYTLNICNRKYYDNTDREWSIRSQIVGFYQSEEKDMRARYLAELEKIAPKVEKEYIRKGIKKAVKDCRSKEDILVDSYPVSAKQTGLDKGGPRETVDEAWFAIKCSTLKFKNNKAKIRQRSSAGYDMVADFVVIKTETGYRVDEIAPIKLYGAPEDK